MTIPEAVQTVVEASERKDRQIAALEAAVTDLTAVIHCLVALASPIKLATFLHVQQAIQKAQRAKDAA